MMEVEYELTLEDVSALHACYRKHPPAARRRIDPVAGIVLLVACTLGLLAFAAAIALHMDSAALLLIGGSAGIVIGSLFENWHLKRMTAPRTLVENGNDAVKILGWARVVLDAQGIHVTSQFSACLYLWNGIEKIVRTEEYIFFYVTTKGAQIVPLRAFADGKLFDAFADAAHRCHSMAGVGEDAAWKPHGATGIQAPDLSSKSETVQGIIPKDSDSQRT
jgi:YcxB-like protein